MGSSNNDNIFKKCVKCGIIATSIEELNVFPENKANKYGKRNICKECYKLEAKIKANENKKNSILYKGGACAMCGVKYGEIHHSAFDFHHLDSTKKEVNIATLMNCCWDRIQKELDKCILLCANCHRTIHSNDC